MKKKNVLLVCDGMNVLHRGHYATPPMSNADGLPTNAIRGLVSILLADLKLVKATHCAVVFDRPGKNFRHAIYPEYKGTREKLDDAVNLNDLVGVTKTLLNLMGIKVYGKRGIEGDDLIGSAAMRGVDLGFMSYISSNDKDFASIVSDRLHLLKPKGVILDVAGVEEFYGVHPTQMVDYLMMLGDKIDNIPGINKVGPVTAAKWLSKHGSLRQVLKNETFTPKMKLNVSKIRPFFSTSKKLITLQTNLLPHMTSEAVRLKGPQPGLKDMCSLLDFKSTYTSIVNTLGT